MSYFYQFQKKGGSQIYCMFFIVTNTGEPKNESLSVHDMHVASYDIITL